MLTLNEWEVRSLTGQHEVDSGAKWQATKMEAVKMNGQVQAKRRC